MVAQHEALFEAPLAHEAAQHSLPEYEWETHEIEGFATRVQPIPGLPGHAQGHELVTLAAARGIVTSKAGIRRLLAGVITPDRGGTSYLKFPKAALHSVDPAEQARHSLRRKGATQRAALAEIRRTLGRLYMNAIKAAASPNPRIRARTLYWAGEALHLIQDSYSLAHMARDYSRVPTGPFPIRYIRLFHASVIPPSRTKGPNEHNFPTDSRDTIATRGGGLIRSTQVNAAIRASREYLLMLKRHIARPGNPANSVEFRAFLRKHLSM